MFILCFSFYAQSIYYYIYGIYTRAQTDKGDNSDKSMDIIDKRLLTFVIRIL